MLSGKDIEENKRNAELRELEKQQRELKNFLIHNKEKNVKFGLSDFLLSKHMLSVYAVFIHIHLSLFVYMLLSGDYELETLKNNVNMSATEAADLIFLLLIVILFFVVSIRITLKWIWSRNF